MHLIAGRISVLGGLNVGNLQGPGQAGLAPPFVAAAAGLASRHSVLGSAPGACGGIAALAPPSRTFP